MCCGFESHLRQLIFFEVPWVCCIALLSCLFDLACLLLSFFSSSLITMALHLGINYNIIKMKSTLKVHNPRVIILLICINDVQGKELSLSV